MSLNDFILFGAVMNPEQLIDELIAIASMKIKPNESDHLAQLELPDDVVADGCRRILSWLRAQTITLQMKPIKLNTSVQRDQSCIQLIQASLLLHQLFDVTNDYLSFTDGVTYEQQETVALWSKDKDQSTLFWTERKQ